MYTLQVVYKKLLNGLPTFVDLMDAQPRWIEVRFEISPEDEPGSLDRLWSEPRRAHVAPHGDSGRVAIRIPASELEAHLRSTGTDVIRGTFSDFVWTLDPRTGVVAEDVVKVLDRVLDAGFTKVSFAGSYEG